MGVTYLKSRLPGPAVRMFDLEYQEEQWLADELLEHATVRVSYTAETVDLGGAA